MRSAAIGALGLGIVLFLASALWSTVFPPTANWTSEKAIRSSELKSKLHNLSFIVNAPTPPQLHSGQDLGQLKAEYEQMRKENDQLNRDFESADGTPKTVSSILRWSGLSLAVMGLIGYYAVNQSR